MTLLLPDTKTSRMDADHSRQDLDTAHGLPKHIVIEGPIGVGKTTLARRIATALQYPVLLEPATENPFLERFYFQGRRHALPTQLFFLLHRTRQLSDLDRDDLLGTNLVSDFMLEKDDLFARLTLDEHEYALYGQIRDALAIRAPAPDLVIYLQAPVNILLQRIRRRGINAEREIQSDYLERLNQAYTEFFHYYSEAPVLVVNAAEIDFAHNESHFTALLQQALAMDGMRQYFNAQPTLL
ncbi:MAG: deoxynucleoside kinase [Pseudomonadales bacterium]